MTTLTAIDLLDFAEGVDVEVKKASGRDGQGELPRGIFESYSAMANTQGGTILLGIEEVARGTYRVLGIPQPDRVLKPLWDGLNNRQTVSVNLLVERNVEVIELQDKQIIRVVVPRAARSSRPVYCSGNPFGGTFRRNYDGDYRCDDETVKRMMAEQVEPIRDSRLLEGFSLDDIDQETLKAYRNQCRAAKPDHVWLTLDDREFLQRLGGWTRDRVSGSEGMTLAGLLMFGKLRSILDAVPYYVVDYQERSDDEPETRWIDRITTDGTWSGNLYDFYRRVIQKLFSDLKVPFSLRGTVRIDDTPVHEALREALVNTLIHADYTDRVPILITKRPGMFEFRNPGAPRLPLEDILRGGTSDCRNRNLQKMFQFVGLGEQAGSGVPRIYGGWESQHWRSPDLSEEIEPDRTFLRLRMVSLLPAETLEYLGSRFGPAFRSLSREQVLALATAAIEGRVTHARLRAMTTAHSHDLSRALAALVRDGFLESTGATRGTSYFFPEERLLPLESLLASAQGSESTTPPTSMTIEHSTDNSEQSGFGSELLNISPEHLAPKPANVASAEAILEQIRSKGKVSRKTMETGILSICMADFRTLRELAELLDRTPDTLRVHYLSRMVHSGDLELRHPSKTSHPDQGYRARKNQPA